MILWPKDCFLLSIGSINFIGSVGTFGYTAVADDFKDRREDLALYTQVESVDRSSTLCKRLELRIFDIGFSCKPKKTINYKITIHIFINQKKKR